MRINNKYMDKYYKITKYKQEYDIRQFAPLAQTRLERMQQWVEGHHKMKCCYNQPLCEQEYLPCSLYVGICPHSIRKCMRVPELQDTTEKRRPYWTNCNK